MPSQGLPQWTIVPFPALVFAIAVLPILVPRAWERRSFQGLIVALCAVPVVFHFVAAGELHEVTDAAKSYLSFVATLGALYVTSGGVQLSGDVEAKPSTNVALIVVGALLASFVGTTGASMLMIRPLLRTNRQREHRAHLVPFFIIAVANAGGLLTPLGDPPLLVGYIGGVPFFWTLRLFPAWILYVGTAALALYVVDRRAYARESPSALARDRAEHSPLTLKGKRNVALMLAVVPAALLPMGFREMAMVAIAAASLAMTPRSLHKDNGFSFAPIIDVAIIFAGLFACLGPIEIALAQSAPWLPLRQGWQLFWASGLLSTPRRTPPLRRWHAA
jgi:Na+/H+ antiporter NhaD/arsenite permease-like protein